MEAMMKTVIEYGPIAYNKLDDYEARANLMWTSSLALNGMVTYGKYLLIGLHMEWNMS